MVQPEEVRKYFIEKWHWTYVLKDGKIWTEVREDGKQVQGVDTGIYEKSLPEKTGPANAWQYGAQGPEFSEEGRAHSGWCIGYRLGHCNNRWHLARSVSLSAESFMLLI